MAKVSYINSDLVSHLFCFLAGHTCLSTPSFLTFFLCFPCFPVTFHLFSLAPLFLTSSQGWTSYFAYNKYHKSLIFGPRMTLASFCTVILGCLIETKEFSCYVWPSGYSHFYSSSLNHSSGLHIYSTVYFTYVLITQSI